MRTQEVSTGIAEWAETALAVPLAYAQQGKNLAWASLAGARHFEEAAHYPRKDVIDRLHSTRFYYHTHDRAQRGTTEHGHFHLFFDDGRPGQYRHIVALSMDERGRPVQWFTTNGWVTGEPWQAAPSVVQDLSGFQVEAKGRLSPVARWLTAMVHLFATDIERLLHERDRQLHLHSQPDGIEAIWNDRRLDVLSAHPIDLTQRLEQLGLI